MLFQPKGSEMEVTIKPTDIVVRSSTQVFCAKNINVGDVDTTASDHVIISKHTQCPVKNEQAVISSTLTIVKKVFSIFVDRVVRHFSMASRRIIHNIKIKRQF